MVRLAETLSVGFMKEEIADRGKEGTRTRGGAEDCDAAARRCSEEVVVEMKGREQREDGEDGSRLPGSSLRVSTRRLATGTLWPSAVLLGTL
ncbi:unnamed protein product [Lampetra fluviatilis]